MRKLKDFLLMFFGLLGLHTLFVDLGMTTSDKYLWEKYLTAAVLGLLNAIYFSKKGKQREEMK